MFKRCRTRVLEELRANGIEAAGEVGDPDPIQAARSRSWPISYSS
jgi:hypothetical protein